MSHEQSLETGHNPTVLVQEVGGNLVVLGWREPRLRARSSDDRLQLRQTEEAIIVTSAGDCQLYLPVESTLALAEVHGDLQVSEVRGAVTVQSCQGNLNLSQVGATRLERVSGDLAARDVAGELSIDNVAGNASLARVHGRLRVDTCAGDLAAKEIFGSIAVEHVAGNASISHGHGDLHIGQCAGDLMLKELMGAAMVDQVSGSVAAKEVQGNLHINHCSGDLRVRGLTGNLHAEISGSAMLKLALASQSRCWVRAGGDITCKVPPALDAHVRLESNGELRIKRLPVALERSQGHAEFTVGAGTGELHLEADGSIYLSASLDEAAEFQFGPFNVDLDPELQREMAERASEWIQQVTEQVERQMEAVSAQLDARLSQLGSSEEIAARVQQKMAQAMRRAEEKIAAAVRQAEERARRAEQRAERQERRARVYTYQTPPVSPRPPMPPPPPAGPRPPQPKRAPVSDEERMMILRMVEQGKISVEQAEKLLAALEG